MDDPFFIFMIVALVAFIVAWIWLSRRGKTLREQQRQQREESVPEVFDRRMLVSRPREFDPTAWDDGPDETVGKDRKARGGKADPVAPSAPAPIPSGEPFVLDRAFLEARRRPQPVPPSERVDAREPEQSDGC